MPWHAFSFLSPGLWFALCCYEDVKVGVFMSNSSVFGLLLFGLLAFLLASSIEFSGDDF